MDAPRRATDAGETKHNKSTPIPTYRRVETDAEILQNDGKQQTCGMASGHSPDERSDLHKTEACASFDR
jgi:hypothetical protein